MAKNDKNRGETAILYDDTAVKFAAENEVEAVFKKYGTSLEGLPDESVEASRRDHGTNKVTHTKQKSLGQRLVGAFVNPFTLILFFLALISALTDMIFPAFELFGSDPDDFDWTTVVIITAMIIISGTLRFVQETRSGNAAASLLAMITNNTLVLRKGSGKKEIPNDDLVAGDIIFLSAGDMIPADLRIIECRDLFISQSNITGESEPIEKTADVSVDVNDPTEYTNIAYMGTSVVSGSATGVIVRTGDRTLFGVLAASLNEEPVETSFSKGVNAVSWVLIRFMLVMVPLVFIINGITKGEWLDALLFGISVAVGLTPEMLPMIVTTCLAKGAVSMSKKKTIIKSLNSIQNFGAFDILCTDKTGTLTQDKIVLEYYLDVHGKEDYRILRHAYLNSYFQTGYKNMMDQAIIARNEQQEELSDIVKLSQEYEKVDEIPFDFNRRRLTVVVMDKNGKTQMITKGAIEEMLSVCTVAEYHGEVVPITDQLKEEIMANVDDLNSKGFRVLGVAQKNNPPPVGVFSAADECDMSLIGYLAFLDPPKESSAAAIQALHQYGVEVKILTGDNEKVTRTICGQVGIDVRNMLLGGQIEEMSDEELAAAANDTNIFAKLTPTQKSRIIRVLREKGHTVGFMGDGVNDISAMKNSDVGISVDTAVDVAKESADVILLDKDLMVLEEGIIEGRKTYANMIKYIKMTASSNFGNMFSVLVASAMLPFLPMLPLHLVFLNLIYDLSCTAIPWDNVDEEFLYRPRKWDASSVGTFMIWIGPTSSVFDFTTYIFAFYVFCPALCGGMMYGELEDAMNAAAVIGDSGMADYYANEMYKYESSFQAMWFIESMWSQTFVIHMIRTPKLPFIRSRASWQLTTVTLCGIAFLTVLPYIGATADFLGFTSPSLDYFYYLIPCILCYMLLATSLKWAYVKHYGELL